MSWWNAIVTSPEFLWVVGWVVLGLTAWLSLGAIGALMAMIRDRSPVEGFVMTLVFGPLGIWIEAVRGDRPPARRGCGRGPRPGGGPAVVSGARASVFHRSPAGFE
jgi:hypothetical protein